MQNAQKVKNERKIGKSAQARLSILVPCLALQKGATERNDEKEELKDAQRCVDLYRFVYILYTLVMFVDFCCYSSINFFTSIHFFVFHPSCKRININLLYDAFLC